MAGAGGVEYRVRSGPGGWSCTCPWYGRHRGIGGPASTSLRFSSWRMTTRPEALRAAAEARDAAAIRALLADLPETERAELLPVAGHVATGTKAATGHGPGADAPGRLRHPARDRDPEARLALEPRAEGPRHGAPGTVARAATRSSTYLLDDFGTLAWATVRPLVREGIVPRPDSPSYTIAMLAATRYRRAAELVADDPALLEVEAWRLFEVEGGGEDSLANHEKFFGDTWGGVFRDLAARVRRLEIGCSTSASGAGARLRPVPRRLVLTFPRVAGTDRRRTSRPRRPLPRAGPESGRADRVHGRGGAWPRPGGRAAAGERPARPDRAGPGGRLGGHGESGVGSGAPSRDRGVRGRRQARRDGRSGGPREWIAGGPASRDRTHRTAERGARRGCRARGRGAPAWGRGVATTGRNGLAHAPRWRRPGRRAASAGRGKARSTGRGAAVRDRPRPRRQPGRSIRPAEAVTDRSRPRHRVHRLARRAGGRRGLGPRDRRTGRRHRARPRGHREDGRRTSRWLRAADRADRQACPGARHAPRQDALSGLRRPGRRRCVAPGVDSGRGRRARQVPPLGHRRSWSLPVRAGTRGGRGGGCRACLPQRRPAHPSRRLDRSGGPRWSPHRRQAAIHDRPGRRDPAPRALRPSGRARRCAWPHGRGRRGRALRAGRRRTDRGDRPVVGRRRSGACAGR